MYIPKAFAAPEPDAVAELLRNSGAADLVTCTADGFDATPVPFVHDPQPGPHGRLLGHLARNNPQWRAGLDGGAPALAIVRGPDAYVTPTWYASKREHGRTVPTWNYVTAHLHGRLVAHDDAAWTEDAVRRLTELHEAGRAEPWSVDDAPRAFTEGQLRAIVGVELLIERVEAKWKLSQNRSDADRDGVEAGLRTEPAPGARAVADAMARTR
ncbi:FMN-binding negative transcriptional regulator [Nocardiopsis composta]|uniref:Transcriptional regulator n=1 Tax=Nocardiopsis composta TaxID=157465 RepID=A0A7W8VBN9_9ACTN|nr:FMN-binding negative transcriptional regulator [Nocardiopsis composta]MBB5430105.1 transcriptional regulator [Nocardiopsis composta]